MEELFEKFSPSAKQIFEELDNKNLSKCREVCKSWQEFIDDEKITWNRILTKFPSGKGMNLLTIYPSLNTYQVLHKLAFGGMGFLFLGLWAAGPVVKKQFWTDYEQLFWASFSCFQGQKIDNFFKKILTKT